MRKNILVIVILFFNCAISIAQDVKFERWSKEKANSWYSSKANIIGANFVPSNAINQIEMWQEDSFDSALISKELSYAKSIGMNSMRVFLHDLVFNDDPSGYLRRIDQFLQIAEKYQITVMFVFFDSVWDPFPYLGKQRNPLPGVHNSGWVQGPGLHAIQDTLQDIRLEVFVRTIVKRYRADKRILCWDIWNEPDNMNGYPYNAYEDKNKVKLVYRLLRKAFLWVRMENPTQPLTTYVCGSGWADGIGTPPSDVLEMVDFVLQNSDILSFHNYGNSVEFEKIANRFIKYQRPVLCTEFLARGSGSTFESILPIAKRLNIGMYCWGLVAGKSNTIHGWHTWQTPDTTEPKLWHHDVFRKNGQLFDIKDGKAISNYIKK